MSCNLIYHALSLYFTNQFIEFEIEFYVDRFYTENLVVSDILSVSCWKEILSSEVMSVSGDIKILFNSGSCSSPFLLFPHPSAAAVVPVAPTP